mgnify:CR=1 FL=1
MSLEENVNENVKPEISAEKKEENGNGENREEGAKPARRPQYRRPRRGQRAPKAVKVEEKEGTENAGAAEPKQKKDVNLLRQEEDSRETEGPFRL